MPETKCGFNNSGQVSGSDLLMAFGPTLKVNIGYDSSFKPTGSNIPVPGINDVDALVDTGALESCIDITLATALGLPIVDRQPVSGSNGRHITNIYEAQVHIPSLGANIIGRFAGVGLIAGGQKHMALIGRTFLKNYKMMYEGSTGTVTISSA